MQALIAPPSGPSKEQIEQIQKPLTEQLSTKDAQIAALTKLLIERNPSAGPGAQQTVGEAVGSIAKGAAEGDARLQHALDLLKANKVADAAALLKTIAEDKTAQAEQATAQAEKDRKDAAIAYRNLGAIAGLRDPKRALEAYEKALALDPDDLESLLWAGWIEIDHGDLNQAQSRFERVLDAGEGGRSDILQILGDSRSRRHQSSAWRPCGRAEGLPGQPRDCRPAGEIRSRQRRLAARSFGVVEQGRRREDGAGRPCGRAEGLRGQPRDQQTGWRNPIPATPAGSAIFRCRTSKVGDVKTAQGDLAGALKAYEDSLAIRDRLAKSDPGNAGWQRDLSVSYEHDRRREDGAGRPCGRAEGLRGQPRDQQTGWRNPIPATPAGSAISRCRSNKIGDVKTAQGDLAGALKAYQDSLAIADRLAKSDPGNAGWQRDLSVSYEKIGDVKTAQGDLAGALKAYEDSLAISDRLAKSDPGNAGWQRDLSVSYEKIGDVKTAQGDLAGALKAYQDSLAIRDRLAKSDPGNAGWQRDLSVSYEQDRRREDGAGRPCGRAEGLPGQPRDQRPAGEIRSRQRRLAARSLGELCQARLRVPRVQGDGKGPRGLGVRARDHREAGRGAPGLGAVEAGPGVVRRADCRIARGFIKSNAKAARCTLDEIGLQFLEHERAAPGLRHGSPGGVE